MITDGYKVETPICLDCHQPMLEHSRNKTTISFYCGCGSRVKWHNVHVDVFKKPEQGKWRRIDGNPQVPKSGLRKV